MVALICAFLIGSNDALDAKTPQVIALLRKRVGLGAKFISRGQVRNTSSQVGKHAGGTKNEGSLDGPKLKVP